MNCTLSEPVNISATSSIEQFAFSKITCGDNAFLIENATTSDASFLLKKEFTYGDVSIAFFAITLIFLILFFGLRGLFFNRSVEIHSQSKKIF
jgi:hypothetical protein